MANLPRYTLDTSDTYHGDGVVLYSILDGAITTGAYATHAAILSISAICEITGGRFYKGQFNGGRFHDGDFFGGEFYGTYNSCTFHGGTFHGGTFHDGTYNRGMFYAGEFHRGLYDDASVLFDGKSCGGHYYGSNEAANKKAHADRIIADSCVGGTCRTRTTHTQQISKITEAKDTIIGTLQRKLSEKLDCRETQNIQPTSKVADSIINTLGEISEKLDCREDTPTDHHGDDGADTFTTTITVPRGYQVKLIDSDGAGVVTLTTDGQLAYLNGMVTFVK